MSTVLQLKKILNEIRNIKLENEENKQIIDRARLGSHLAATRAEALAIDLERRYRNLNQLIQKQIEGLERAMTEPEDVKYLPSTLSLVIATSTKSQSFNQLRASGKLNKLRGKILDSLSQSDRPLSRREISRLTGISLSSTCGRCNELLHSNQIQVIGRAYDDFTNRSVEVLSLVGGFNDCA